MNKVVLLFFCGFLISCGKNNKRDDVKQITQDSALIYFEITQDKMRSLTERRAAAEKGLVFYSTKKKDTNYTKILYKKNWLDFSLGAYDSLLKYDSVLIKHALKIDDKSTLGMKII